MGKTSSSPSQKSPKKKIQVKNNNKKSNDISGLSYAPSRKMGELAPGQSFSPEKAAESAAIRLKKNKADRQAFEEAELDRLRKEKRDMDEIEREKKMNARAYAASKNKFG